MLTEQFIASIGEPERAPGTNVAKDAAIFIHEFQPVTQQRALFKKSATPPNCLAVSKEFIFAAQVDKSIVHLYNRGKGNLEATVPFVEPITCITLACEDAVLVLGTAEGRIFLWETATGRQVATAQSHLQAVKALAVDPTSNFLLSASADSTVHVWSIFSLLSFFNAGAQALSPLRTFTSHRAEITALALGHSSTFCNIAITASKDKTCLIWDYHTNHLLRTYLLPAIPSCLTLDTADRAVYLGYEDGSIQRLDLYTQQVAIQNTKDAAVPLQPGNISLWKPSDATIGTTLSLSLSFDSCTLLSGHQSGSILALDVATGRQNNILQNPLPGPVKNLLFLPVPDSLSNSRSGLKFPFISKPKLSAFDNGDGSVPGNYTLNVELVSEASSNQTVASDFDRALTAPSFPVSLIDDGLNELTSWGKTELTKSSGGAPEETEDYMALDDEPQKPHQLSLEEENVSLKAQIEALRRLQTASFGKIEKVNSERKALLQREQRRLMKGRGEANARIDTNTDEDMESNDESS